LLLQILDIFYSICFIILISMIAGNLIEIRLPKIQSIQSRKCLQKFNFKEIISPGLSTFLPLASTQRIFSFHDVWNVLFRLSLLYLWPSVSCGVFSVCNLLLSVSRAAPLTLKKTGQWLRPFLCLNCSTNTLKYYRKNYRFRKAHNWS
jgi:hypothetical protein